MQEAPGPLETSELVSAPSPGLVENATAPVGSLGMVETAMAPIGSPDIGVSEVASALEALSPGDENAQPPNSTEAHPPVVGMGFKIGRRMIL